MKFLAEKRATQLREVSGFAEAGVYDPDTIGGTHVIYVLHDITKPEKYGNLPAKPRIPLSFTVWKDLFKPIGLFGAMLGFVGVVMHYVFEGPRREQPAPPINRSIHRHPQRGRRTRWRLQPIASSIAPTPSTAWAAPSCMRASCCAIPCTRASCTGWWASSSFLALLSGFGIYLPWIFRFFTPLFGGGAMTRFLHPWFGLGFVIFFGLQALNWCQVMRWTPSDTRWMKRIKSYVRNEDAMEPADVGFFNAGQKMQFWEIVGGCIAYVITGLIMWFPEIFGRSPGRNLLRDP